jgi:c-di-GMP-binding flagellar brake protein YcgR
MQAENKNFVEHRRDERFNLPSPWRTLVRIGEENLEARLVDISKGGVKIRLTRPSMSEAIQQGFEINLAIFLIVFLPSGSESRFNASIRWVQRFTDVYIMGLQFIDPVGKALLAEMRVNP